MTCAKVAYCDNYDAHCWHCARDVDNTRDDTQPPPAFAQTDYFHSINTCPTCGSNDPAVRYGRWHSFGSPPCPNECCTDPYHSAAALSPRDEDAAEVKMAAASPQVIPAVAVHSDGNASQQHDETADLSRPNESELTDNVSLPITTSVSLNALHEAATPDDWDGWFHSCTVCSTTFKTQEQFDAHVCQRDGSLRPYPDALIEAADALLTQLDRVCESPEYKAVFMLAYAHGDIYRDGPSFEPQAEALREALDRLREGE